MHGHHGTVQVNSQNIAPLTGGSGYGRPHVDVWSRRQMATSRTTNPPQLKPDYTMEQYLPVSF